MIASFCSIDIAKTTGRELRRMVATAAGFPAMRLKLVLSSGHVIGDYTLLSESFGQNESSGSDLRVSCILSALQPMGPKNKKEHLGIFGRKAGMILLGRKAGMILERRLEGRDRIGRPAVSNLRTPDPSLRASVHELITASFSQNLAPLIDMGLDAAHQACPEGSDDRYVYQDEGRGACADLSSCQLWTRILNEGEEAVYAGYGERLAGAVLGLYWRSSSSPLRQVCARGARHSSSLKNSRQLQYRSVAQLFRLPQSHTKGCHFGRKLATTSLFRLRASLTATSKARRALGSRSLSPPSVISWSSTCSCSLTRPLSPKLLIRPLIPRLRPSRHLM